MGVMVKGLDWEWENKFLILFWVLKPAGSPWATNPSQP